MLPFKFLSDLQHSPRARCRKIENTSKRGEGDAKCFFSHRLVSPPKEGLTGKSRSIYRKHQHNKTTSSSSFFFLALKTYFIPCLCRLHSVYFTDFVIT